MNKKEMEKLRLQLKDARARIRKMKAAERELLDELNEQDAQIASLKKRDDYKRLGVLLVAAENRAHRAEEDLKMRPVLVGLEKKPRYRMKARTMTANPLDGERLWS